MQSPNRLVFFSSFVAGNMETMMGAGGAGGAGAGAGGIMSSPFVIGMQEEWTIWKEFTASHDILSWQDYQQLSVQVWKDWIVGMIGVFHWLHKTLHPIWVVIKLLLWRIAYHLYLQVQSALPFVSKGFAILYQYAKTGVDKAVQFEKNLTPKQQAIQAGIVLAMIGLYLFYRWLQRTELFQQIRNYFAEKKRLVKEYVDDKKRIVNDYVDEKKRFIRKQEQKVVKAYREVVNRISKFSSLLAMTIPHALFVGVSIVLKLLIPSVVTYLACETSLTSLISWWYPFLWTIVLLHQVRSDKKIEKAGDEDEKKEDESALPESKSGASISSSASVTSTSTAATASTTSTASTWASVARTKPGSASTKQASEDSKKPVPSSVRARVKKIDNNPKKTDSSKSSFSQRKEAKTTGSRTKTGTRTAAVTKSTTGTRATTGGKPNSKPQARSRTKPQPRMTRATRLRMERMEAAKQEKTRPGTNASRRRRKEEVTEEVVEEESAPVVTPRRSGLQMLINIKKFADYTVDEQITFWLHYWNLYASVQLFKALMKVLPIVSRIPFPMSFFAQVEMLFFIWVLFTDHTVLVQPDEEFPKDSWQYFLTERPPIGVTYMLESFYLPTYEATTNAISEEFWNEKVVKKVASLMDALVLIRFLSSDLRDWLMKILSQLHSFLIPSITLSMPGFFTQYGVFYVQYVVPNAHVAQKKEPETVYLQYWTLHMLFAAQLNYWSSLIWWIPFSTHVVYVLWCMLSFTNISSRIYNELESELEAFGLLPKKEDSEEKEIRFSQTKTAMLMQALVNRLPSAIEESQHDDDDVDDNNSEKDVNSTDGMEVNSTDGMEIDSTDGMEFNNTDELDIDGTEGSFVNSTVEVVKDEKKIAGQEHCDDKGVPKDDDDVVANTLPGSEENLVKETGEPTATGDDKKVAEKYVEEKNAGDKDKPAEKDVSITDRDDDIDGQLTTVCLGEEKIAGEASETTFDAKESEPSTDVGTKEDKPASDVAAENASKFTDTTLEKENSTSDAHSKPASKLRRSARLQAAN